MHRDLGGGALDLTQIVETLRSLLAEARLIAVAGRVERTGQRRQHVTLLARALKVLPSVIPVPASPGTIGTKASNIMSAATAAAA